MNLVLVLVSVAWITIFLMDGFEVMILPRRVTRNFRPARTFYRSSWKLWRWLALWFRPGRRRESFLSYFGPLSLLGLFGMWILGLITGFGLLHWSLDTPLRTDTPPTSFLEYWYFSGTTFLTLGYGDLTPTDAVGKVLAVAEAAIGFGFIAMIIGYLPTLYQAFSRREVTISLLDARAGSPPTAAQMLLRLARDKNPTALSPFLAEWERWAAEVLESQLSYPVLSYYRSQHDNQSWLAAMTAILDTCALLIAGVNSPDASQARLTFAMARHAVVDLALVFRIPPQSPDPDRLPEETRLKLWKELCGAGVDLQEGPGVGPALTALREMYEPFLNSLSHYFVVSLPGVMPQRAPVDNWQTSAWTRRTPGLAALSTAAQDEHFD